MTQPSNLMEKQQLLDFQDRQLLDVFCDQFSMRLGDTPLQSLKALSNAFSCLPYENLTKIIKWSQTGRASSAKRTPNEVLFDHWELGTGGTCFSLTATLLHLVRSLGLTAKPVLADRYYGQNTHSALLVWIDRHTYLLDPGYLLPQPIALEKNREVEIETPFNHLILSSTEEGKLHLYTQQGDTRSRRLTFKTSPVDSRQFFKAWDASFSWTMMNRPFITQVRAGKQFCLNGCHYQIRSCLDVKKQELTPEQLYQKISSTFGIGPSVVYKALSILSKKEETLGLC